MKVYREVVIDMSSGEVLHEDFYDYVGPVAQCRSGKGGGGGGGAAGSVDYALWIKNRWIMMMDSGTGDSANVTLNYNVFSLINEYANPANNPYSSAAAHNPNAAQTYTTDSHLERIARKYTSVESEVDAIDPETKYSSYVDTAVSKAGTAFPKDIDYINNLSSQIAGALQAAVDAIDSAPITDEVNAFENRIKAKHMRSVARFAAEMSMINAVNSSSFTIGMALLEREYSDEVVQYRTKLNMAMYDNVVRSSIQAHLNSYVERYRIRDTFIGAAAADMLRLLNAKETWQLGLSGQNADIEQVRYAMLKEYQDREIALDVSYDQWRLDVLQFGANVMAGLSGGTMGTIEQQPSDFAKAIGSSLSIWSSFANIGAMLLALA